MIKVIFILLSLAVLCQGHRKKNSGSGSSSSEESKEFREEMNEMDEHDICMPQCSYACAATGGKIETW
jgi:hypothetical protein